VVTVSIGAKYGCFLAFAIVFVVMGTLIPASLIGILSVATMGTEPTPETALLLASYWIGVCLIPLGIAAFFGAFFLLARALTRPDEKRNGGALSKLVLRRDASTTVRSTVGNAVGVFGCDASIIERRSARSTWC